MIQEARKPWNAVEHVPVMLVMALMGGFYWAIRGTGGYGGETGGMYAGFGWALLWYAFSQCGACAEKRPYGTPWIIAAITLGITLGGFTGYGVYAGWVKGQFYLDYPNGLREVAPWTGYAMFFLCGLHWGGNTGCFMAWCAPGRPMRARDWALRIGCGVAGAVGALMFVRAFPQLFLPFYAEGLYAVEANKTCIRALDSIQTIAPHVGSVLGFLAYEVARRDRRAVAVILTLGLGFAVPFSLGAYWHTEPYPPFRIDWWKNWEMSIGLGGGLAFGLAFWLFNRPGAAALPAPGRIANALFRSEFLLWLAVANALQGVYDGVCNTHGLAQPRAGYLVILAACMLGMLTTYAWRRRNEPRGVTPPPYRLSLAAVAAFQLILLACGWAVTIPAEWRFGNTFLVLMYSLYIGVSLALIGFLRLRQTRA